MTFSTLLTRHRKILWTLVITVIAGMALYMAAATATYVFETATSSETEVAYEQQENLNDLWYMVAGEQPIPQGTDEYNQLAKRLSEVVHEANSASDITSESFSAPNKVYRGISDDLGFDPFESDLCNECGDLSVYMVESLQTIKSGGVDSLVVDQGEFVSSTDSWSLIDSLNPFLEAFLVWQFFGMIGMLAGLRNYGDDELTWRPGDGKYDNLEYACIAGAPLFMLAYLTFWNRKRLVKIDQKRQQRLSDMGLAIPLKKIETIIEQTKAYNPSVRNRPDIQQQLAELEAMRLRILDMPDEEHAKRVGLIEDAEAEQVNRMVDLVAEQATSALDSWERARGEIEAIT